MYPILFNLFGTDIYASPLFLALAIFVGIQVGRREALRRGFNENDFTIYWVSAIPLALLFAVLNGVLFRGGWDAALETLKNPAELFSNGLVSFGAVVLLLGWGFVLTKIRKQPAAPSLDTISLMLPLILGIYRIGCILNGCCYGEVTDSPLGMYLPNAYGEWAMRYPTQLMILIFDFALFAFLWQWRLKKPVDGRITYTFILSFSALRFLVDGLRELPNALGNYNLHQLMSASILLITLYFMFEFRPEKKTEAVPVKPVRSKKKPAK
jgi:phosphatidylglycerol:prolipoprotein diacylglycerol transferase